MTTLQYHAMRLAESISLWNDQFWRVGLKTLTQIDYVTTDNWLNIFYIILYLFSLFYISPCRTADLEAALVDTCDFATLKSITKSRPVPSHLRAKIWQVVTELCITFELQWFDLIVSLLD